jgi:hypothetical protein
VRKGLRQTPLLTPLESCVRAGSDATDSEVCRGLGRTLVLTPDDSGVRAGRDATDPEV